MKKPNLFIIGLVIAVLSLNLIYILSRQDPYTQAKIAMVSPSAGDRYFGRLSLWYLYAKNNDWANAQALETGLDPVDLAAYKAVHYPPELKKSVNNLVTKPSKTIEDWMELARVDSILGKNQESLEALTKAKTIDPIRDDISSIYYQTVK